MSNWTGAAESDWPWATAIVASMENKLTTQVALLSSCTWWVATLKNADSSSPCGGLSRNFGAPGPFGATAAMEFVGVAFCASNATIDVARGIAKH